jgi:hypothetical protein
MNAVVMRGVGKLWLVIAQCLSFEGGNEALVHHAGKVIIDKSRGEVFLLEQDTIENVS